jgi:hypothetical protein
MARSSKKVRVLRTLKYPVTLQAHEPEFEQIDLHYLDVDAVTRAARTEIPLGFIKTCCCGAQLLRAEIRKGMVTAIRIDEPAKKERTPISRDFAKMLRELRRNIQKRNRPAQKFPIPVSEFLNKSIAYDIIVQTLQCVRICFWSWCITCCWRTDIPDAEAICGHISIDTTVLD